MNAFRRDLDLPSDVNYTTEYVLLQIAEPKTRFRCAHHQMVKVVGDKGRQGETKASDPSPASRHALGDKGTKQNHLSPASRQRQGETRNDKAK